MEQVLETPPNEEAVELYNEQYKAFVEAQKAYCLTDFFEFCVEILHYKDLQPFHEELCRFMESGKKRKKLILLPRGHLKALKTKGTMVLTSSGYFPYEKLREGDEIIGVDGLPKKVIKIHPKEKMSLYEVITNDERKIICNEEHLFTVRIRANDKKWKVRNLKWIMKRYSKERLDKRDGKTHFEHPVQLKTVPVFFEKKNLLIDPYTLGMWLGDGHSSGSRVSSADEEEFSYSSFKWHRTSGKYNYDTHGLHKLLREENLLKNKHIPEKYLFSSYEQRVELLRGLMDTDGTYHCQGGINYFSNTNYRLIKNFISLVRSLGGIAMVCKVNMQYLGEPYDTWQVSVRLPKNINPFNLTRKKNKFSGYKRELAINIVDIKKVEDDIANCITVEGGEFITDDYFPTHNSTIVTVGYSLWRIAKNPNIRILIANATAPLAESFLRQIKNHLQHNKKFIELYGDMFKTSEKWADGAIRLAQTVSYEAKENTVVTFGIGGNLVSQHYDLMIFDDLVNRENTHTEDRLLEVKNFYKDAQDLVDNPMETEQIVIGTRWTESDLYGDILDKNNPELHLWDFLERKGVEGDYQIVKNDKGQFEIVGGDILYPFKFPREAHNDLLNSKGLYDYSAQYLNDPYVRGQAIFKHEFKYYEREDIKTQEFLTFITIDPSFYDPHIKAKEGDFTGAVVNKVNAANYWFLADLINERLSPNEIIDLIFRLDTMWKPKSIGIETNKMKVLAYQLREEMRKRNHFIPIIEIEHGGMGSKSKDDRIQALEPRYAVGNIFHDRNLRHIVTLESQLVRFPRIKYDDLIDALAMQLEIAVPPRVYRERSEGRRAWDSYTA